LVTGPLWAKPVWGIWWTWDARLTSTFVLWLLFISYLMLRRYLINPDQAEVLAAVVSIIGFADALFDYMSIRWFRTQPPQPVIAGGPGSGLDPKMQLTLAVSLGAFLCLAVYLIRQRVALARTARELSRLRRQSASKEARAQIVKPYLFVAFASVRMIFMFYVASLSTRQERLSKELYELELTKQFCVLTE